MWTGNMSSGSNFKAEYLYDELAKRKIPAVIMEPLLGGRLSNVPDHIVGTAEAARTRTQCGVLGIPLCRFSPGCTDSAERHDLYGTFAG